MLKKKQIVQAKFRCYVRCSDCVSLTVYLRRNLLAMSGVQILESLF